MQLIGFIKEYNNINTAVNFDDIVNAHKLPDEQVLKIFNYLNQGVLITTVLSLFTDLETSENIGTGAYLTDGFFIWPSYFPYYLNKTNRLYIDSSFLDYLEHKNYTFDKKLKLPKNIEDIFFEHYDSLEL